MKGDPIFQEALDANQGRYAIDAKGSIVDALTGKAPGYVYGWPFPTIDPADPQAGIKIVWNYFYTTYYGGNGHYRADLLMISRGGLDRAIEVDAYFKHHDGQHPRFREDKSQGDLLTQTLSEVSSPVDVAGTVSLTWRYRGPERRDSVWVYVPLLRRVRQVSPTNRADGFLGSDLSQDDGPYFDGKVEDFTWRLVGEQDLLVLFDRPSLEEPTQLTRFARWRVADERAGGCTPGVPEPGLEGRTMVPASGGADSAAALDRRGGAEGPLLPVRQDSSAVRPGLLPRQL